MRTITKLFGILALFGAAAFAQTTTTNTTLCAAVTANSTSVCLSSTTGVVNQTGLYVDGELMLVQLSSSQTLAATNAYVPVMRATRAGTVPTPHNSGAIAWVALTPSQAIVPGANGFEYSTQFGDLGPCTRGAIIYLPHIWPDRNLARDCVNGAWTDYNAGLNFNRAAEPVTTIAASGAITVGSGKYVITKSSAAAVMTLGAPTAGIQDGTIIIVTSSTAQAHTITATGLIQDGSTTTDVATFAAHAGASLTLMAYNGKWIVLSSTAITFT